MEFKSNRLKFGDMGLKSTSSGLITARQIEAARRAIVRKLQKKGKIWIRIFPDYPVTKKPNESRMGKGTGSLSLWCARVRRGTVLFEICGVPDKVSEVALLAGGHRMSVTTAVFK